MTGAGATDLVIDASAMVALLADGGATGGWVAATTAGANLCAPHLLPYEVGNILRRHVLAGLLDLTAATLAHVDLVALPLELHPYEVTAGRAWQLRSNLTVYDASYVALAELLSAPLVTLDSRLSRAPGIRCQTITPPS
jgi:predicted nucleic acid-binding protein